MSDGFADIAAALKTATAPIANIVSVEYIYGRSGGADLKATLSAEFFAGETSRVNGEGRVILEGGAQFVIGIADVADAGIIAAPGHFIKYDGKTYSVERAVAWGSDWTFACSEIIQDEKTRRAR